MATNYDTVQHQASTTSIAATIHVPRGLYMTHPAEQGSLNRFPSGYYNNRHMAYNSGPLRDCIGGVHQTFSSDGSPVF